MAFFAESQASRNCARCSSNAGARLSLLGWCTLGMNPIQVSYGVCLVDVEKRELSWYWTMGKSLLQWFCRKFLKLCRAVSTCWLVFSLCLSVCGWYMLTMFCLISNILHIFLKTFEVNLVSQSKITLFGSPTNRNTCSRYNFATSNALMSSLQGSKITTLVQSWSVTISIMLYPFESGSFTIKSIAMVENGHALGFGGNGCKGGRFRWVFVLFSWHLAQPLM